MELFLKIALAVMFGFMAIRMWPWVRHHLEHGPKGTSRDWMEVAIPLVGVVAFVALLMALV